jgi:hypothetical protein
MKAAFQCVGWNKKGSCFHKLRRCDIHKKYSVLCALDESGRKLREGRVEGNAASGFAQFFAGLDGPSKAVVEACWNWGN